MAERPVVAYHDQPLRLLRNVTYPSYQLHALAGRGKTPPATVLAICVLETFAWLRKRFRDLDVPPELQWPEPDARTEVDPRRFASFRIDNGYKVEVVWLPDEQIWTLQLTEPDLGSDPGAESPMRPPVPGRLFETNIAFRALSDSVECGFRTIVSDIEGTKVPCEVYRLGFIKHLVRNPLVGLRQGWPLQDKPHRLETVAAVQLLQDWLKDKSRMMPAVVVAERSPEAPVSPGPPTLEALEGLRRLLQDGSRPDSMTGVPATLPILPALPVLPGLPVPPGSPALSGSALPPVPPLTPHAAPITRLAPKPDQLPENESSARLQPEPPRSSRRSGSTVRPAATAQNPVIAQNGFVVQNGIAAQKDVAAQNGVARAAGQLAAGPLAAGPASGSAPEPYPPFIEQMAHLKMGYAQFFLLPLAQQAPFQKLTGRTVSAGDILLIEPLAFGGETVCLGHQEPLNQAPAWQQPDQAPAWQQQLDDLVQNYPKDKPMAFGRVVFLSEAKELERSRTMAHVHSREELLKASDERAQAAEARHREELRAIEERCQLREDKIRRLEAEIDEKEIEKALLREALAIQEAVCEAEREEREAETRRIQALRDRPDELAGIPAWVRKHLGERLVLLPRAVRELNGVAPGEINLQLLCDALEYLAVDHRDVLLCRISLDDCRMRCQRKYNRHFEVTLQKGTSIEMFPSEYKVKYSQGAAGRSRERVLEYHLKVGDKPPWLMRIYFFFDSVEQRIVVGSLPKHLPTVSYNS